MRCLLSLSIPPLLAMLNLKEQVSRRKRHISRLFLLFLVLGPAFRPSTNVANALHWTVPTFKLFSQCSWRPILSLCLWAVKITTEQEDISVLQSSKAWACARFLFNTPVLSVVPWLGRSENWRLRIQSNCVIFICRILSIGSLRGTCSLLSSTWQLREQMSSFGEALMLIGWPYLFFF